MSQLYSKRRKKNFFY